jgi:hypothetical protein
MSCPTGYRAYLRIYLILNMTHGGSSMEPKELAEKFKAKAAAETTNKEAAQAALDRERADIGKADDAVKTAFEKVVVPYLNECRAAFPPNQFVFAIFQSDANDSRPLGVSFKIGKGLEVKITSTVGRIKVNTSGLPSLIGEDSLIRVPSFVVLAT